jgi:hypothetical protein
VVIGLCRYAGLDQVYAASIHDSRHIAAGGYRDADSPPAVIGYAKDGCQHYCELGRSKGAKVQKWPSATQ